MRRANQFFMLGIVGLSLSLTNYFFITKSGSDVFAYIMPWIVFLIIGITRRLRYVKK